MYSFLHCSINTFVNPATVAILGYKNPVQTVLRTGRVVGLINHAILISKDGIKRIVADSGAPIRDEEGNLFGVVLVFRDITEIQRMEEELRKLDKLESVGTLAGGIAHDFNNLLTGIMGNISLAKRYVEPKSKAEDRLLEAEKASLRARDCRPSAIMGHK